MKRSEKEAVVEQLKEKFQSTPYVYFADSSALTVAEINDFRRVCYEKNIEVKVAKNTLIQKALQSLEDESYNPLFELLKGQTTLLFTETANAPAKVLKDFRKEHDKPVLKFAYIETSLYTGDNQIDTLSKLKSKEELLGEIVTILQSPAKNVISALKSSGGKLAGIVKTLSERES